MAVPKRRMSRANTRTRRSSWKAAAPALTTCPQCRSKTLPHSACGVCGTYRGRQVLDV